MTTKTGNPVELEISRISTAAHSRSRKDLSHTALIAYGAPALAVTFIMAPLQGILPGIYAKYFGLELAAIAGVLLISRLLDGISDPMVGYFSDRHRAAGGSRKSWVIAGGILLLVSANYLYSPPPDVSLTYYLIWSIAIYLGWTLADIPHNAWGFELTRDYQQRVKVFSYRTTGTFLGTFCFYILPFLPIFSSSAGEYTPEILKTTVFIGIVLMLLSLGFTNFKAPAGDFIKPQQQDSARSLLRSVIDNKPLLIFLATYSAFAFSFGMWGGLSFMYLDGYLNLGNKIAVIFLAGSLCALCIIPLTAKLITLTGKQVAWGLTMVMYCTLLGLFWLLKPDSHWALSLILCCGIYASIAFHTIIAGSMLGDIVDYGEWKFHRNRGATFSALLVFLFKLVSAAGAALGIALVGYFGFVATTNLQSESAVFGLKLSFVLIPLVFALTAAVLAFLNPITRHRHNIICKIIHRRDGVHV